MNEKRLACPLLRWIGLGALFLVSGVSAASQTSAPFTASFSGLVYDRATQTYNSVLTITNTGASALVSPLKVVISAGNASVAVVGSSNGSTYLWTLSGGGIAAGKSATTTIAFSDPSRVSFTPKVVSVTGASAQDVVPNVVGAPQAAATAAIASAGLTVGTVTMQSSASVAIGLIISESPAAGTNVASGSAVNLVISSGAKPTGAPNALISAPSSVLEYATVLLDGSDSTDAGSTISAYAWAQTSGPNVSLHGAATAQSTFSAPVVTAATSLGFSLTVTDAVGVKSVASASITVGPATADQLRPQILSTTLLVPDTGAHTQVALLSGPPLIGSSLTLRVAITGALQNPLFDLVDGSGNVLSSLTLSLVGVPSNLPLVYAGSVTVPSKPFYVGASGTTTDGQRFSIRSFVPLVPMNMFFTVIPSRLLLAPGSAGTAELTIYNGGAAATFALGVNDPHQLLQAALPAAVTVAAGGSHVIPVNLTYPADAPNLIGPMVSFAAKVVGDPTRSGTTTVTLWDKAQ